MKIVFSWLGAVLVLCGLGSAVAWRLSGGQWERVETPSMGTVAPVGTLLWVQPVEFSSLRVGDFITFHPPGHSELTYSHRVFTLNVDGTVTTKGVLTAPDPWRLTSRDVVGKVAARWWGVGWLVQAAPLLGVGALLLWLLCWKAVAHHLRLPVAIVGTSVLLSLVILIYRPLVRAEQLSFAQSSNGARATYVSTGMLPLRLQAVHGGAVNLRDGESGSVLATRPDLHGRYQVGLHAHLPLSRWLVLGLVCFLPALWTLIVGMPPAKEPQHAAAL